MTEELLNNVLSTVGLKPNEMDTIEFQEIIPGIKPPRVPLVIPGMDKLPLLPGWTVRAPNGAVLNKGAEIPTIGGAPQKTGTQQMVPDALSPGQMADAGYTPYPEEVALSSYQPLPVEEIQLSVPDYYPEEAVLAEVEDMNEPVELSVDDGGSLMEDDSLVVEDGDMTFSDESVAL